MSLGMIRVSDRFKTTLSRASERSAREKRKYLSPEHLLLTLLESDDADDARLFKAVGLDVEKARTGLEARLKPRPWSLTGRKAEGETGCKGVVDAAMKAGAESPEGVVGTAQLLAGFLVAEDAGVAGELLKAQGLTVDRLRDLAN